MYVRSVCEESESEVRRAEVVLHQRKEEAGLYSNAAPKAIPNNDTTAGIPKLGRDDPAPETALVAAPALQATGEDMSEGIQH